jgi:hypothetical protein
MSWSRGKNTSELWSCANRAIRQRKMECTVDAASAAELGEVGSCCFCLLFVVPLRHSMIKR